MTVLSPCVSICELDELHGWCKGCFRTLEEITDWPELSYQQKQALLAELEKRKTAARHG